MATHRRQRTWGQQIEKYNLFSFEHESDPFAVALTAKSLSPFSTFSSRKAYYLTQWV